MHLVSVIEQSVGRKARIEEAPMQPGDVRDTHADIRRIGADYGYAPTTSIEVGIPRFVEWYRGYRATA
jgi:UDP-glucuronate 4-epimerase